MTSKDIVKEAIASTEQELERLKDKKNRSRYFIFGLIDAKDNQTEISLTYESAHEKVLKDVEYHENQNVQHNNKTYLFKLEDFFLNGAMKTKDNNIIIFFTKLELQNKHMTENELIDLAANGIEYVKDSRPLLEYTLDFLKNHIDVENLLLHPLLQQNEPVATKDNCCDINLFKLNESQSKAVKKAINHMVTFYWGPPGTGKTKTKAALAANIIANGGRVLIASLSNNSVDQLFGMFMDLDPQHKKEPVARLGSTMDEKWTGYGKASFNNSKFRGKAAGDNWYEHVRNSKLVAANFTVLARNKPTTTEKFDLVITDEVSMADIPSLIVASFFSKGRFVAGGDPRQLPPIFPEDADEPNPWFKDNIFKIAGIESDQDPRVAFLDTQYRMEKEIGSLVSQTFYEGKLKNGEIPISELKFPNRILFSQCSGEVKSTGGASKNIPEQRRFNQEHADSAARIVLEAISKKFHPNEIGIITPYNAQVVKIRETVRKLLEKNGHSDDTIKQMKIATIHSFQGQERRMIILDFTDNNITPSRLTAKKELINVAISRAKEQLCIIGNQDYLLNKTHFRQSEIEVFEKICRAALLCPPALSD